MNKHTTSEFTLESLREAMTLVYSMSGRVRDRGPNMQEVAKRPRSDVKYVTSWEITPDGRLVERKPKVPDLWPVRALRL